MFTCCLHAEAKAFGTIKNCLYALNDTVVVNKERTIDTVMVEAKRVTRIITSAKPVQNIEKDALEQLGISSIADAVKMFSGTTVKDYGGIGGMKTVSIRNLGAHHTAVSYDGVTISNTQAGQIDIGRYSLDNVQSLSLAIGDNDDLMLTARHFASAGVLSINTERPHFDYGHNYSIRLKVKSGSFGLANPSLRYWQKISEKLSLSLNGDYMRADGAYPFTLINGTEKTEKKRRNSDIYTWRGEANLYFNGIKDGELNVKAYGFYSQRGLPGSVILYVDNAKERLWDKDFFTQASFKKRFSDNWKLSANLKYVHTWNKYVDTNVKYQNGKNIETNRQNEIYASATVGWTPIKNFSMSLAQDFIYGNLRSNAENPPQPKRYTSLTAFNLRYKTKYLDMFGGLVGTFATENVQYGKTPNDRKKLSPTLSVSYRPFITETFFIRAMMKNTFRVPTFNDLYYNRIGTVTLRPEKADEYNLGFTWQGAPLHFLKYLALTVDGYYNDVKDKIVAYPSMYVWKMANFGKVRMYGVNITLGTEAAITNNINLVINGSYSLQKCIDVTDKTKSYYKSQIPYTPKNTGSCAAIVKTPYINLGYTLTACGERYALQQNTDEYKIKPYCEHTVTASHEFRFKTCRLNMQASIVNLTDKQYDIIRYYPMPGRSWNMTGALTF